MIFEAKKQGNDGIARYGDRIAYGASRDDSIIALLVLFDDELQKSKHGHSACCATRAHWKADALQLREVIRLTIMENLHLADGDVCTLKRLKDAINFQLPPEE